MKALAWLANALARPMSRDVAERARVLADVPDVTASEPTPVVERHEVLETLAPRRDYWCDCGNHRAKYKGGLCPVCEANGATT